ncbi:MAG TPA: hypothetical protein VKE74_19485 [Gemmataceae bacterium]|nr:hypothetical protein [Gemmataceae bacterium]
MSHKKQKPPEVNKVAPPPRRRLSVPGLLDAIPRFRGNLAAVARSFGVTRTAVWKFVQRYPELQEVAHDARETRLDNAESSLDRAILAGEPWAIQMVLKTLGKDRGYVERTEQHHSGSVAEVHLHFPDNGRDATTPH